MSETTTDDDEVEEEGCGYSYDHKYEMTYEGDDGWQGVCRECGAELFEMNEEGA